jgi:hypothetical protein
MATARELELSSLRSKLAARAVKITRLRRHLEAETQRRRALLQGDQGVGPPRESP